MPLPIPLEHGHDPEIVRVNIRALAVYMPYPNACLCALQHARRWWAWENGDAELPPHLCKKSDANQFQGSYELILGEDEGAGGEGLLDDEPVARARSAEAAYRASRRMDLIDAPIEVVPADDEAANMAAATSRAYTIVATRAGQNIVLRPRDRLGNDFKRYTEAARPAYYDRGANAQIAPLTSAPEILEKLRGEGFLVEMSPDLLPAIEAAVAAPRGPESKGLVSVVARGSEAVFEAQSRLGDYFGLYRDALKAGGAVYRGNNQNVAPLTAVPKIVKRLSDDGFSVSVDPALAGTMASLVERAREDVSASAERAEKLDAQLREKGKSLRDYQKEGIAWLSGRRNAMILDDQGVGKTIQTLAALPSGAPVVVVCPAVVKGVWRLEAELWRPEFRVAVLATKAKEAFRWPEPGEIVVTNYDNLPDEGTYGPAPRGTVLVGDEAHWIKGGKTTARGRRFAALANNVRANDGRTWGLTGTPMANVPPELWNVLEAFGVATEAYGSKTAFAKMAGGELVEARGRIPAHWEWTGPVSPEVAERLRRVSIRRRKEDVLKDLPPKVYQNVPVEISAKDRKALEKALKEAGVDVEVVIAAIESAANGKSRLPMFTEMSRAREILAKAKIPSMLELIEDYEEQEEPVVVFSSHKSPIDALSDRPGWGRLTGDESAEERAETVAAFQAGKLKGVAATIRSAGTGITLTRAQTSVFVDQDWTPTANLQAEDRICRLGQTRGCNIKVMVADHAIDERVNEILAGKRDLIDETVGASAVIHVGPSPTIEGIDDVDFAALAAQARAEIEEARAIEGLREEERERRRVRAVRRQAGTGSPARAAAEEHAARAMQTLAALDPDFAATENMMGFSKIDGGVGHELAEQIASGQGLTEAQWRIAVRLANKYRRQTGEVPVDTLGRWLVEPDSGVMVRALTPGDVLSGGVDPLGAKALIRGGPGAADEEYLLVDGWTYGAKTLK